MCSTERKYPTDKPWAFMSSSAARTARGRAQGLAYNSDSDFSNGANWIRERGWTSSRRAVSTMTSVVRPALDGRSKGHFCERLDTLTDAWC